MLDNKGLLVNILLFDFKKKDVTFGDCNQLDMFSA